MGSLTMMLVLVLTTYLVQTFERRHVSGIKVLEIRMCGLSIALSICLTAPIVIRTKSSIFHGLITLVVKYALMLLRTLPGTTRKSYPPHSP
jgi:hypothetical protein